MASAGSVVVDLLMKTASFETDVKRAEKKFKDLEKSSKDAYKGIRDSFAGNFLADAFMQLTSTLATLPGMVLDGVDALNDVADATGATVENISALEDVAVRTGGSIDTVSGILVKFNGILKSIDGKNEASLALDAIGLSAEELKSIDPAEALRRTAVALSGFADDGNKARIVQELFGKSVAEAAPFLKDLAEQTKLVGTVTTEQAAAVETFNKSLFELKKNVTDLAREISGPLVEALNDMIADFKRGSAEGKGFFENSFDRYKKNIRELYGMQEKFSAGATGSWGMDELAEPLKAVLPDIKNLKEEQDKLTKAGKDAAEESKKAAAERASEAKRRLSEFNSYFSSLERQLEGTKDLTAVEQTLLDISKNRVGSATKAQKEILLGMAQEIEKDKELAQVEKERIESTERFAKLNASLQSEVARIYEETRTPLEVYTSKLERLQELYDAGHIKDIETFTRATAKIGEEFVNAGKKVDETSSAMSNFAEQAQKNIQDALGDTLEQTLEGNFDSIGDMWKKLLTKMAAQAIAAQLNDKLFAVGSSGSGSGNLLGSLINLGMAAFGGGAGSAGNAGFGDYKSFYDGGGGGYGLATGTNYIPYDGFKATLHEGEAVVPKEYNPAAGGTATNKGITINPIYNIGDGVNAGEVKAAVEAGNAKTKAELYRLLQQRAAI